MIIHLRKETKRERKKRLSNGDPRTGWLLTNYKTYVYENDTVTLNIDINLPSGLVKTVNFKVSDALISATIPEGAITVEDIK
jgi:hypothetical protein